MLWLLVPPAFGLALGETTELFALMRTTCVWLAALVGIVWFILDGGS